MATLACTSGCRAACCRTLCLPFDCPGCFADQPIPLRARNRLIVEPTAARWSPTRSTDQGNCMIGYDGAQNHWLHWLLVVGLTHVPSSRIVILAVYYPGSLETAGELGERLAGKVVVDISSPLNETLRFRHCARHLGGGGAGGKSPVRRGSSRPSTPPSQAPWSKATWRGSRSTF